MPNYVYNTIQATGKDAEKLEEIAKVGLAEYYRPMPKELVDTTSPSRVGTGESDNITPQRYAELKEKFGYANWYDWAVANWGAKWGCGDNEFEDGKYTYTTAWSPLLKELIELLAKDVPNFTYTWEEEQGFGEEYEFINGEFENFEEWDSPDVEELETEDGENEYYFLEFDHREKTAGYFSDYHCDERIGDTKEEAEAFFN